MESTRINDKSKAEKAWQGHCRELAAWAWDRLAIKKDRHGMYSPGGGAEWSFSPVTKDELANHFAGQCTLGLGATSLDDQCLWVAFDLDNHVSDVATNQNLEYAIVLMNQLIELGFKSVIIEDSDGKGGIHLWVLFSSQVSAATAHKFAAWLVRDAAKHNIDKVELRPHSPTVQNTAAKCGLYLRTPGKHHKRNHWSRFWGDGEWLDYDESVKLLLSQTGDDPALIPEITTPPAKTVEPQNWRSDDAVVERAKKYIAKIPGAVERSSGHNTTFHVACVLVIDFGLTQDQALDVISEWNATCQPPWSEHELRHKLESASQQPGERGRLRIAKPERWPTISIPARTVPRKKATGHRLYHWTDRNDIGNAADFSATYADELRYCAAWKKWLAWDGYRWKIDDEGRPLKLAKELVTRMFNDAHGEGKTGQCSKEMIKHICESAMLSRINAMIALAGPDLPIRIDELDKDGWILNCLNGVVDLKTGELMPHDRTQGITKLCPTTFDINAQSPAWDKFLRDVFADDDLIQFVQRLFGHFLTADVSEQKLAMFYGTGANGKSTLLNAFMETIGPDYTMQCMPDFLMEKKGESHPTEKASLFGKRFVSCVETEQSRKLAESTVKMLTGGEKIMARRMREDFWEFNPTHKLVLCTNHRPIIAGTDHGIWRRLLLVPFLQRFDGPRQDKQLPEKLKVERAGILAWAVRGCLEWQRIGLKPPASVSAATEDYRSSEDTFGRFIADTCVVGKAFAVRFSQLYARLAEWSNDAGEFLPSKRDVGGWLTDNGFDPYSANGRHYRGLMLRETSPAEDVKNSFTE